MALMLSGGVKELHADGMALLEPDGRPLCTGEAGQRAITAVVPDGEDGYYLLTWDERPELSPGEWADAFLVHLDPDLTHLPFGEGMYASSSCGALLLGGPGFHYSAAGATIAPGRLAVALGYEVIEGPGVSQLWIQSYDPSGGGLFGSYPLRVSTSSAEARLPFLLPDGEGGLFVAWNEAPEYFISQIGDLFLQRFDSAGRPMWEQRLVVSGGIYGASAWPVLAPDGAGGVYVSFLEPRVEEYPDDYERIRVQRVAADGTLLWPRGGLTPWTGNRTEDPISAIVSDGVHGALSVFAADGKVRAQRLSPGGERLWGDQGIILSDPPDSYPTPYYDAFHPTVLPSEDGGLFVLWEEWRERGISALMVRRLERDGRLPWPRPVTLAAHDAGLWKSRAAVLSDGSLSVVWEDSRSLLSDPSDGSDVYIQAVDRRGRTKAPLNGMPVITAPLGQRDPIVVRPGQPFPAPSGADSSLPQALVFWSDGRFPSLTGWPSTAFVAQVMAFTSRPRIDSVAAIELRESTDTTVILHGDDLQDGLSAEAGRGISIEASVRPDSPDGPGDSLTLRLRVGPAPEAAPGARDLSIRNPDGGSLVLKVFLEVRLDPDRIDPDRSGRVDGFDLAVLARAFGEREGDDLYSGRADIDADGLVDGADLALLASRFGESKGASGWGAESR